MPDPQPPSSHRSPVVVSAELSGPGLSRPQFGASSPGSPVRVGVRTLGPSCLGTCVWPRATSFLPDQYTHIAQTLTDAHRDTGTQRHSLRHIKTQS